MKKLSLLLTFILVTVLCISLVGCGERDDVNTTDTIIGNCAGEVNTTDAIIGDYAVEILGSRLTTDWEGAPVIIITYKFTNNSEETISAFSALYLKAYQNGVELLKAYFIDDYSSDNEMRDLRPAASLEIEVAFELDDSLSPVEFVVTEFAAEFWGTPADSVSKVFSIA